MPLGGEIGGVRWREGGSLPLAIGGASRRAEVVRALGGGSESGGVWQRRGGLALTARRRRGGTEVARVGSGGVTASVASGSISPPPSHFVICLRYVLVHARVHLLL